MPRGRSPAGEVLFSRGSQVNSLSSSGCYVVEFCVVRRFFCKNEKYKKFMLSKLQKLIILTPSILICRN